MTDHQRYIGKILDLLPGIYKQLPVEVKGLAFVLVISIIMIVPASTQYGLQGLIIAAAFLVIVSTLITLLVLNSIRRCYSYETDEGKHSRIEIVNNVIDVTAEINEVLDIELKNKGSAQIDNFGLDLGMTMPWFEYQVLQRPGVRNVAYRGLILDHNSPQISALINGGSILKARDAETAIKKAKELVSRIESQFNNITLEIRSYDIPPIFHGFLINDAHLILGFTEVVKGKLQGACFPYQYFRYDNDETMVKHMFSVYQSWFEYFWNRGQQVVAKE